MSIKESGIFSWLTSESALFGRGGEGRSYFSPRKQNHIGEMALPIIAAMTTALIAYYAQKWAVKQVIQTSPIVLSDPATNLTRRAKQGEFQYLTPDNKILEQVILGLMKKEIGSVLLVGPAGSGKTALVQGLAHFLACAPPEEVPSQLKGKQIVSLTASDFIAGASYLGQKEARMQSFLQEIMQNPEKYIIFIDEFHTMAGNKSFQDPNSNLLEHFKPLMADGTLRIIGATTDEEKEIVLADRAIARRFNLVSIKQPDRKALIEILWKQAQDFAAYHGCGYFFDAIEKIADLSFEMPGNNPAKAIGLLDDLGVFVTLHPQEAGKMPMVDVVSVDRFLNKESASKRSSSVSSHPMQASVMEIP